MENNDNKPVMRQATKEESKFLSQFKTEYRIGYDRHDNSASYCLVKHNLSPDGENTEIILSKYIDTDSEVAHQEFKNEVRNLSNYFGATIIKETQDGEGK